MDTAILNASAMITEQPSEDVISSIPDETIQTTKSATGYANRKFGSVDLWKIRRGKSSVSIYRRCPYHF